MNKKLSLVVTAVALCAVLVTVFGLQTPTTAAAESTYERLVTVHGEAKLKLEPNLAILSVAVQTENKSATVAASTNAALMEKVMDALEKAGVEKDTISTEGYNLYEVTHWDDGKRISDGYRVSNNIKFETSEIDKVGELYDVAIKAGANSVNSPQFTIADKEQVKLELLELAMKNAEAKADVLVKAVNAARGPVVTISENSINGSFYRNISYEMSNLKFDDGAGATTPIQAGDIEVTANVTVAFAIQ